MWLQHAGNAARATGRACAAWVEAPPVRTLLSMPLMCWRGILSRSRWQVWRADTDPIMLRWERSGARLGRRACAGAVRGHPCSFGVWSRLPPPRQGHSQVRTEGHAGRDPGIQHTSSPNRHRTHGNLTVRYAASLRPCSTACVCNSGLESRACHDNTTLEAGTSNRSANSERLTAQWLIRAVQIVTKPHEYTVLYGSYH